jgi:hypothetical protein
MSSARNLSASGTYTAIQGTGNPPVEMPLTGPTRVQTKQLENSHSLTDTGINPLAETVPKIVNFAQL